MAGNFGTAGTGSGFATNKGCRRGSFENAGSSTLDADLLRLRVFESEFVLEEFDLEEPEREIVATGDFDGELLGNDGIVTIAKSVLSSIGGLDDDVDEGTAAFSFFEPAKNVDILVIDFSRSFPIPLSRDLEEVDGRDNVEAEGL
ncbi:hypothetical protein AAF712_001437 [Marasmius tenuissimus]|uniref:Uncharacterized protein n=1 Tax=Marasmius tenuissimus TaxID=585030 RepID=A0ABR3AC94_9AGAR